MGSHEVGRMMGLSGDVGFFSLGRGKAFSTYEGGIIVTDNESIGKCIAEVARALSEYSLFQVIKLIVNVIAVTVLGHPMLFWIPKGLPFLRLGETLFEHSFLIKALSPFQAGLAWNWKKKLERLRTGRNENALWWANFFHDGSVDGIFPFIDPRYTIPDALRFPVRIEKDEKRETIFRESEKMGMGIRPTYPLSLDELPELGNFHPPPCPHARLSARTVDDLALPMHMSRGMIEKKSAKYFRNLVWNNPPMGGQDTKSNLPSANEGFHIVNLSPRMYLIQATRMDALTITKKCGILNAMIEDAFFPPAAPISAAR